MVKVSKHGLMEPNILENGKKIKLMVKEDSFMSMVIFMMVSGLMIKLMAMECINM
jgi:hypothetical protein